MGKEVVGIRYLIIFLALVLSLPSAYSSWMAYQNDNMNTGVQNGSGTLGIRNLTNLTNYSYGMRMQPLVADIDNNGLNDIVTFTNTSLVVLDRRLNLTASFGIGIVQGQHALYNIDSDAFIEIMLNHRVNNINYFSAYEFNGTGFNLEYNTTLPNPVNRSGIKCADVKGSAVCIFVDNFQDINIVNLSSKAIDTISLGNGVYNFSTIPAIADFDFDGRLEAVFWFNNDSDYNFGILVYDIENKIIDLNKDDIIDPICAGPSCSITFKGNPVFAKINNAYYIAFSAMYDDSCNQWYCNDRYGRIWIMNSTGGITAGVGCSNDGSSGINDYPMTNPVVFDANNDGANDFCVLSGCIFAASYANITCYNLNGQMVKNTQTPYGRTYANTLITAADMNSDSRIDFISRRDVLSYNGSALFTYNLETTYPSPIEVPIATDVDGNGALDLLWTDYFDTIYEPLKISLFYDFERYVNDLSVKAEDVSFSQTAGGVKVNVRMLNNGSISLNDVNVSVTNADDLVVKSIKSGIHPGYNTLSFDFNLSKGDKLVVQVDPGNAVNETDELNNMAEANYIGTKVYFSIDTDFGLKEVYSEYLNKSLFGYNFVSSENDAEIVVAVGRNDPVVFSNNVYTLNFLDFGVDLGVVKYMDKRPNEPYAGLVSSFELAGKLYVFVYGNDVEGDIASLKALARNNDAILSVPFVTLIDTDNIDALSVYDFLHIDSNQQYFKKNNDEFKVLVRRALNDEMAHESLMNLSSDGFNLRLKHFTPNMSFMMLAYINSTSFNLTYPAVFSGGIWSNIDAWKELGIELANMGKDVWLIEITGGPAMECDNCFNYYYDNLTDSVLPAYILNIKTLSGASRLQYVGHSNGARTMLDSLTKGNVNPADIETLVAVGVPGNFSELSLFAKIVNDSGTSAINTLNSKGKTHVTFDDVAINLDSTISKIVGFFAKFSIDKNKISLRTFEQYSNWISFSNDSQPSTSLSVDNFILIQGNKTVDKETSVVSDIIVPVLDLKYIYGYSTSPKKYLFSVVQNHPGMANEEEIQELVKISLNKSIALNNPKLSNYQVS